MATYADDLTELDMEIGRSALTLHGTLEALFEHQTRNVDMEQLPVPTRDDWGIARRIVDHAAAANTADRWVGTVGRALHEANGGVRYGHSLALDHDADVSEQEFDEALQGLFSPVMATGNLYHDPAAVAEWNRGLCERGYGELVGGVFYGPDGQPYPVAILGDDDGPGSGWSTIGSRRSDLTLGEPLSGWDKFFVVAGAAVGGGYKMHGWQSVGTEQRQYLGELPETSAPNSRPPSLDPHVHDPFGLDSHRNNRANRTGDRLDIAVGALEGLDNVQQAENNRHYVSEVVYQQHADGPRRAVIHIYQVQSDGSKVRVAENYGRINRDGSVERVHDS